MGDSPGAELAVQSGPSSSGSGLLTTSVLRSVAPSTTITRGVACFFLVLGAIGISEILEPHQVMRLNALMAVPEAEMDARGGHAAIHLLCVIALWGQSFGVAPPAFCSLAIRRTFRWRDRFVNTANQGKRCPTPRSRRTARTMITATQCRCARTLLRWSVSKLSSAASVSQCETDDFELERREPSAIAADVIRRAFEEVGVVFLPEDDVQLRRGVSTTR